MMNTEEALTMPTNVNVSVNIYPYDNPPIKKFNTN